ncbi:DUF4388 domain-containing protein [Corallococcus praedator]|uniref:DUF4388 domain-containing protein n=1 Tax=Corallococcus praedator TaxID=2316724 RepID=A0ABX9QKQ8_9BACT|nr:MULTISPECIES: DUF4388 domain-containing protein [Corallococcus]RKH06307.1 DUF4388 domain-containing protein [Corallococcus sp. CA047B]RKH22598.1 DUF4388 domain-containing protein [Corallococcus sp. CA031C]RKI11755.1 DUF4388 domain-containing protein [Corallococcus praedator]
MRGVSGDFSTMPLKDLVVHLGNRRATGTLNVERGDVRKQLLLRDGHVITASSNQPREYFGQFLINMGHLTEDQLERAFATQAETHILLGKILTMTGSVTEATVRTTLSHKFREMLLDAFTWEEGGFDFRATDDAPELEGLDVSVDLLDVHREGEFRETAWQAIRAVFPSGGVRLEVDERKLADRKAGSMDDRIVQLAREGLSIDGIALALHATDFFLYQRLYALYRQDALKVSDEAPLPAPERNTPTVVVVEEDDDDENGGVIGSESSSDEVLQAAQLFLDAGNLRDGEALARRAHEIAPSEHTQKLLRDAEARLLAELRKALMEPSRVPTLRVSAPHLKTLPLSSPERYLLSRIDGKRDVAAIVHVSPLQELEALKFFQGFVDTELVKLTLRPLS